MVQMDQSRLNQQIFDNICNKSQGRYTQRMEEELTNSILKKTTVKIDWWDKLSGPAAQSVHRNLLTVIFYSSLAFNKSSG